MSRLRWPDKPADPAPEPDDPSAWIEALPTDDLRSLTALLRVAPRDAADRPRLPAWAADWLDGLSARANASGIQRPTRRTPPTNPLDDVWHANPTEFATKLRERWPHLRPAQRADLVTVCEALGIEPPPEPQPAIVRARYLAPDVDPLRPYGATPSPLPRTLPPTIDQTLVADEPSEPRPTPTPTTRPTRPMSIAPPEVFDVDDASPGTTRTTPEDPRDAFGATLPSDARAWRRIDL